MSFNPRAALYPFWLSWNGFWGWQILFMVLWPVLSLAVLVLYTDEHAETGPYIIGVYVALAMVQGLIGNALLARRPPGRPSRVPFLILVAIGIAGMIWLAPQLWHGNPHEDEHISLLDSVY